MKYTSPFGCTNTKYNNEPIRYFACELGLIRKSAILKIKHFLKNIASTVVKLFCCSKCKMFFLQLIRFSQAYCLLPCNLLIVILILKFQKVKIVAN